MQINKCDLCHKIIKDSDKKVLAGLGWLKLRELCPNCGKPIIKFLKKTRLIEETSPQKTSRV